MTLTKEPVLCILFEPKNHYLFSKSNQVGFEPNQTSPMLCELHIGQNVVNRGKKNKSLVNIAVNICDFYQKW